MWYLPQKRMHWKLLLKGQPSNHFPGLLFWIFPTIPPSFGTSVQNQHLRHWENLHHCQGKTLTLALEPTLGQRQRVRTQYLQTVFTSSSWNVKPCELNHPSLKDTAKSTFLVGATGCSGISSSVLALPSSPCWEWLRLSAPKMYKFCETHLNFLL